MSHSTIVPFGASGARAISHGSPDPFAASIVSRPMTWLAEAVRRYRTRRALATLDDVALKDIGLNPADADYEANKPFWRA